MAAKILYHSLELKLLHGFLSYSVQRNNPTLDVCWLAFCAIMIIKTYIFLNFQDFSSYFSFAYFGYYQNLVIWLYSSNLIFCVCSVALRKKSGELFFFFHFFNKIQDGRRITCYSEELELFHWFVSRKQLTLVICWLDFGVILKSHCHVVHIKIWWQYCISL